MTRHTHYLLAATLVTILFAREAAAQRLAPVRVVRVGNSALSSATLSPYTHAPLVVNRGWGWQRRYGGYHASTLAEGLLRGQAARIEAEGRYNYDTSAAAINLQTAYEQALDNDRKKTETYFEKKQLNDSYRAAARARRVTREQVERISQNNLPDRLDVSQFNAETGQINWPRSLQKPRFDEHRDRFDALFAARTAADSGIGSENYRDVRLAYRAFRDELSLEARHISADEYTVSRNFVDALHYEARFLVENGTELALSN